MSSRADGPIKDAGARYATGTPGLSGRRPTAASPSDPAEAAARAHALLEARGATVATAESLTGGLIGATLTDIPGASAVFRGGIICYATDVKSTQLGVPEALLAVHGAVHPQVAVAMARGARDALGATFGLAVTGVAGPGDQDGLPAGTVHVALCWAEGQVRTEELRLAGDRRAIREQTVTRALALLCAAMTENTLGSSGESRSGRRCLGTKSRQDHVIPPANRKL